MKAEYYIRIWDVAAGLEEPEHALSIRSESHLHRYRSFSRFCLQARFLNT
jgi:hypothetical protein